MVTLIATVSNEYSIPLLIMSQDFFKSQNKNRHNFYAPQPKQCTRVVFKLGFQSQVIFYLCPYVRIIYFFM